MQSPKTYISPRVSWILSTPRLSTKMTLMREVTPPMETPKRAEAAAAVGKSVTRKPEWEINSQSLEDTQVRYILQKRNLNKYTGKIHFGKSLDIF